MARKATVRKARRKPHWSRVLARMRACDNAREWAAKQPSLAAAWAKCTNANWMRWWLYRMGVEGPQHSGLGGRDCPGCRYESGRAATIRKLYPVPPTRKQ